MAENEELDVRRLRLEPGDIVVISTPHVLSIDVAVRWRDALDRVAAGHQLVILDRGASIAVLSRAQLAALLTETA